MAQDPTRESKALSSAEPRGLLVGVGRAIAHHGELLQGVFEGADGRLHRALLTLPYHEKRTTATFWPDSGSEIRVRPSDRTKAAAAVALTLKHLGVEGRGGDLTFESAIPIGHGYGSSTSDVIAAIRAAAASTGMALSRANISSLAVRAEAASDSLAYGDQPVLFAHREGIVLEHFGAEYPPLVVVGFRVDRAAVDTLLMPRARYSALEIEQFRVLRGLVSRAIEQQDPGLLGRVATISAHISQRHLPKPRFEHVLQLAEETRACGVQVSHSGTVVGLLFDAQVNCPCSRAVQLGNRLKDLGFGNITSFTVNAGEALS